MRPQLHLEGVAPPQAEPPELLERLRGWDPGGIGRWAIAGETAAPLSATECTALAREITEATLRDVRAALGLFALD